MLYLNNCLIFIKLNFLNFSLHDFCSVHLFLHVAKKTMSCGVSLLILSNFCKSFPKSSYIVFTFSKNLEKIGKEEIFSEKRKRFFGKQLQIFWEKIADFLEKKEVIFHRTDVKRLKQEYRRFFSERDESEV